MTPKELYQRDLSSHGFSHDPAQQNAVNHLQRLYDDLLATEQPQRHGLLGKLKNVFGGGQAEKVKGLYFWGGVGRGKTYLVDTFYNALPFERKMRIHFHRFMHRVHDELKQLKGRSDPLPLIADKFAEEARVLCFDEFFVQDITDAMILGTLMQELFKRGVVLVATSNIVPDDLYKNGLQRQRFVPAIELINAHCEVVNVDGGIDYRMRTLTQAEIFHSPLDDDADENLVTYFKQLAPDHQAHSTGKPIVVNGREIATRMEADDVAMFEFDVLCGGPRSQNDYMELSRIYHAVLLANVRQMGEKNDDISRRFIALVDEFYERHVKLIMSAEVVLEELYSGGRLSFEFKRCISRLQEMQSHEYLAREHLA
ncbi:cell division protein ZapE [Aliidiomarina sedimenti]|uniref:Cell division protein ZapE n=1 Tax=Aliidiomarina sedimenti TaxID=1933879 RepID=A0ABY0BZJ3_9GAMM|nr:cell division protein ZapE [Aliidiomarina sedimenti]RUO30586.1 cell division protein ZapE [Aliidiomarina sedimenti]